MSLSEKEYAITDREANDFACYLLVPDQLLEKEKFNFDFIDDKGINALAKKYQVPVYVMVKRITEFLAERRRKGGNP